MKRSKKWISIFMAGILAAAPMTAFAEDATANGVQSEASQAAGENLDAKPETTTPEGTTPEVTTPETTTPEVTTPEVTTPEVTTPEGTTPEGTTPEGTTPEGTTPDTTAPEAKTPDTTTPDPTTPAEPNGVSEDDAAIGSFKLIGSYINIGSVFAQEILFDKEIPDRTYTFKASDFACYLPAGYYIVNPDEEFNFTFVKNEEGKYELAPYLFNITVQKSMPATVPSLKVEYRYYEDTRSILNGFDIHGGDYKVVYEDTIDDLTMDLQTYTADNAAVSKLGYKVVDDVLNRSEKVLSLNCFDDQTVWPDFQTPWIPSTFLSWTYVKEIGKPFLKDGALPMPVCDDTVVFVVDEIASDNTVNIGYQTEDGNRLDFTTTQKVNKITGELTLSKDNVTLPSGYELVDETESHTVRYLFNGEKWAVEPNEVIFTVKKSEFKPVVPEHPTDNGNTNTTTPPKYEAPQTTTTTTTKTFKTVKTGDTANTSAYIVLLVSALGLAGAGLLLKKKVK